MKKPNSTTAAAAARAGRVAAIQAQSDGLAILIAETGGSGFTVTDSIRTDGAQVAEVLKSRRVDLVIRLVPGSATICRVVPAPEVTTSDRAQVADALLLMAESELPTNLPWHRRSAGLLRLGERQAAVMTGWVSAVGSTFDSTPLSDVPEVWVAEIAALGALARAGSAGPMVGLADAREGVLSLLAFGPKRALGRVLRMSGAGEWTSSVRAAWAETAAAAGVEIEAPGADGLLATLANPVRIGGGNRDREWISRHGLAAGALALYADTDAAVSSLVGLTPTEPRQALPLAHRTIEWLSRPRNGGLVAAACIGLMLFAPWVSAEARYSLLKREAGSLTDLDTRLSEADQRAEFYRLLGQKRWPMTKVMAEIAGAAPVGVMIESVELTQGEPITIRATAESLDLVSAFRKNLSDTTVFVQVATPTTESSADGVNFQLQARLSPSGPMTAYRPIQDYSTDTLAKRLYGENATNSSSDWDSDDETDDRSSRRDDRRSSSGTRDREASRPAREERPAAPAVIPPPLSDADIAAMDKTAAMKEWGVRRKASTQSGLDPAVKERLAAEAEKCKARMQSANAGGGK